MKKSISTIPKQLTLAKFSQSKASNCYSTGKRIYQPTVPKSSQELQSEFIAQVIAFSSIETLISLPLTCYSHYNFFHLLI